MLNWTILNGSPVDEDTLSFLASGGHLEML